MHLKKALFLVAIAIVKICVMLSVPTIIMMINAQVSSSGDNNRGDSGTDKQQMGSCVVGAGGPCNGDSNDLAK